MKEKKIKADGQALPKVKADGWANILTGLGIKGKDKRMDTVAAWNRLEESDAEQLYSADDIATKIVDVPVDEALREGWKLTGVTDVETKKMETEFHDRLKAIKAIEMAWKYARIYGGGGVLIVTDDTLDFSTPLAIERVKNIRNLIPFTRWELSPGEIESDLSSKNYGLPKYYSLSPRGGQGSSASNQKFHHSRVIRFDGKLLPPRLFSQNNYWHDSVLNSIKNPLANFNTAHDSAALAIQDFRVGVFKLKNLMSLVANNQDDLVRKRLDVLALGKSVARHLVVDADGESIEYANTSFSGVPEILEKMTKRLQAAAPIPHTRLFGDSPAGMGGSGRHEEVNFYDFVSSLQENDLYPALMRIYRLIAAQPTVAIKLPTEFDIEFNPLWQMDEKELVEIRAKQATTDQIYLEFGVADASEIRESRFGTGKWSPETKLTGEPPAPILPPEPAPQPPPAPVIKDEEDCEDGEMCDDCPMLDGGPGSGCSGPNCGRPSGSGDQGSKSAAKAAKAADRKVESAGNAFDKNPTPENEAKLKEALKARGEANVKVAENRVSEIESKIKELKEKTGGQSKEQAESNVKDLEGKLAAVRERKAAAEKAIAESKERSAALKERLKALQGKKDSEDMIPPKSVQDAAAEGLEMRKKWGRGGTNIGVKRAADIASGKPMSRTTLARMAAYQKHLDACDPTKLDADGGPSAQHIAAMLWGGKEGIDWAQKKLDELDGRQ